ncbi:SDR family NAD(P)-dependent oxidoreductase [Solihabitans fulvus]|uniref:SDR family NAD(P)-dependent oxidoreductase n=1 Tax=Solihabitans fulvus TaxID=1892852 RepID=A0A5B2X4T5_9PSEU|nr:SDR family NAD(P)-dependent oxidoreductase [Solihabitans fulvus]KAA2258131.1 SDR family NAD(P)-dependent oxidoreductase [Solihabitans fulvus]
MSKAIAVFGAGPGLGRSVARRFGREGFRVALVARTQTRLDALVGELAGEGIEAAGFAADLMDRAALPGVIEAITRRFGQLDVVEYAPASLDWIERQLDVREVTVESFEFPLDLLLRTPVALVRELLPGMVERGDGALLFGLAVTASAPVPSLANIGTAAAAARGYLQNLNASLADTGVYAGLVQVAGMIAGSDGAKYVAENWDPALLPAPLDAADLADAFWDLYVKRDRFEEVVGGAAR